MPSGPPGGGPVRRGSADAVPLRHALLDGARRLGIEHPMETAKVFGNWHELVGAQVAARCEPSSLGRGILRVVAANPAWANELRYLAPEVIRRVNAGVGAEVVRELKVTLKGAAPGGAGARGRRVGTGAEEEGGPPPEARGAAPVVARRAETAAERAEADRLVSVIGDEKLAAATKRALLAAKTRRNMPRGRP